MSPSEQSEQFEQEERLKKEVEEAKALYESTKQLNQRRVEYRVDPHMAHPDGGFALTQALKAQDHAFKNYSRALIRFNRFILDGKLPEEPENR